MIKRDVTTVTVQATLNYTVGQHDMHLLYHRLNYVYYTIFCYSRLGVLKIILSLVQWPKSDVITLTTLLIVLYYKA